MQRLPTVSIPKHTRRNTFFLTSFRVMTRVHINLMEIMPHYHTGQKAISFQFIQGRLP